MKPFTYDDLRQRLEHYQQTYAALGLSRVSARRYLEHLVESNKVEVTLRYGGVGRRERRYAWRGSAY